ncbi:hypothetical protein GCM10007147_42260 [Nocardiopsis kunsanensis]|uniref:Uncharacterized protein n=1 Tax=Nocardiopsis kunsanensis TaxID=141693 RepID=A0A918XJW9_9ACTN|nr:hypothetical protein GCM10007147_42260 [Nocardiopsis kunsanensis]
MWSVRDVADLLQGWDHVQPRRSWRARADRRGRRPTSADQVSLMVCGRPGSRSDSGFRLCTPKVTLRPKGRGGAVGHHTGWPETASPVSVPRLATAEAHR